MALIFERLPKKGLAILPYLLGDDSGGDAAVFDPTSHVETYIEPARSHKLSITHTFETHIHADLVRDAREIGDRVQSARGSLSHVEIVSYGLDHEQVTAGDQFLCGSTFVTVRHTPGHTPEQISYQLPEEWQSETP